MAINRRRPLIGVSMYRQTTEWWSWTCDAALVPGAYLDVVEESGGQPVLIPPGNADGGGRHDYDRGDGCGRLDQVIALLDGLMLIGGGDIDARRYGQPPHPDNAGTNHPRDQLELGLLTAALRADLPLLAVCRGMQLLNVGLGGDLVQQLPDLVGSKRHQPRPGGFGRVSVTTEEGSIARTLLGERTEVLCSHHQAIGVLGRDLTVTARSDDGVIEAVELAGRRFVVGVQWHPEESGDRRLFAALVSAADARSTQP